MGLKKEEMRKVKWLKRTTETREEIDKKRREINNFKWKVRKAIEERKKTHTW